MFVIHSWIPLKYRTQSSSPFCLGQKGALIFAYTSHLSCEMFFWLLWCQVLLLLHIFPLVPLYRYSAFQTIQSFQERLPNSPSLQLQQLSVHTWFPHYSHIWALEDFDLKPNLVWVLWKTCSHPNHLVSLIWNQVHGGCNWFRMRSYWTGTLMLYE